MSKYGFVLASLLCILSPLFAFGEEGFIGENPGLDFYSKIDEGNYKTLEKTLGKRLQETPTLEVFGSKCAWASTLLKGIPTTKEMLDDVSNQDYTRFYDKIMKNSRSPITSDIFQNITLCLKDEYERLKANTKTETDARVTISYLGLYMDGDKSNSDYDIISDIEKINSIIFSENLKYEWSPNAAGRSLKDFLANKAIAPLFPLSSFSPTGGSNPNGSTTTTGASWTTSGPTSGSTAESDLRDLLAGTCSDSVSLGSVDDMVDEAFLSDLSSVLASGGGAGSVGGGYGYSPANTPRTTGTSSTTPGGWASPTSAWDFFHGIPCDSTFCIKFKMVPGSTNALGGGKNDSIEWLLDKHIKIMEDKSNSALGCEVMTNNTASSPKKGLSLIKTLAGLQVFLDNKSQKARRDKKEVTPEKEAQELKDITSCSYASAGLSTDPARSRSIGGAGYTRTSGYTTETIDNSAAPLGVQEAPELARFTNCITSYMDSGRKSYYDSFSTDLTEIQAYTANMLTQINNLISNYTEMDSKKDTCS